MPFNIPYCTITSHSSIEYGNDSVDTGTIQNPITLTIESLDPNQFPITPDDFRVTGAVETSYTSPTYTNINGHPEIEQVEFIQDGQKVLTDITLVNSFAMNDQNQTIDICIEGSAGISSTVTGTIFNVTTP